MTKSLLNSAENLKCRLSESGLKETKVLVETVNNQTSLECQQIRLSKVGLEQLLIDKGLLKILKTLFEHTLASSKGNGCELEDLDKVVLVGGGSRIPLIQKWLEEQCRPIQLLKPPSIEAVAIGALSLTPGVTIRDVLQKGVSLRCWDQKNQDHMWHPLFIAGQPWPTTKPLEIILSASKVNQNEIELKIGEPDFKNANEIIYVDGIPTLKEGEIKPNINPSIFSESSILLTQPAQPGEDCVKLKFSIDSSCQLIVEGFDIRNNQSISPLKLGSIR